MMGEGVGGAWRGHGFHLNRTGQDSIDRGGAWGGEGGAWVHSIGTCIMSGTAPIGTEGDMYSPLGNKPRLWYAVEGGRTW